MSKSSKFKSLALGLTLGCAAVLGTASASSVRAEAVQNFVAIEKPAEGTIILAAKPKVSLSLLTAAGTRDPKVDWSENAQKYLSEATDAALKDKKYSIAHIDADQISSPEAVQVMKLNAVVTTSIAMNAGLFKLPTKTTFDWTIGEGATLLVPEGTDPSAPPRYILFLQAEGSYSSGGRAAMFILAAAGGASIPMGGQIVQASLVDLKTGKVVWYEANMVGPGVDIRTAEGATTQITALFKKLPL